MKKCINNKMNWYLTFFFWMICIIPALSQIEPCGLYEWNNLPGYDDVDFFASISEWNHEGSFPLVPDHDQSGKVTILDLILEGNCARDLTHGLTGNYYGFEDGSTGQVMTFPDFSSISFSPTVTRIAPQFEVFDSFQGFLNSNMLNNFGASFTGWIWIPEDANYSFQMVGSTGARVSLDGTELLFFDGAPNNDTAARSLNYGLHPVEIEYYKGQGPGSFSLSWQSTGGIVGPGFKTIDIDYLFHTSAPVADHTVSEVDIHIFPASGFRTVSDFPAIRAYVVGPDGDVSLTLNGQEQILRDGLFETTLDLRGGLNQFLFEASDASGRHIEKTYSVYFDPETISTNGLAANLYATGWVEAPIPSLQDIVSTQYLISPGTQLSHTNNNLTEIDGRMINGGGVVVLEGVIDIEETGAYEFQVEGNAGLYINGEYICGINNKYANEISPYGSVQLDEGHHHYRLITSNPSSGPEVEVTWSLNGQPRSPIPDNAFRHGPKHIHPVIEFVNTKRKSGGRVVNGVIAEYVFSPSDPFADTSGYGFDLWPDPRAIPRDTGGITYQTGGALSSEQAGVHMITQSIAKNAYTLEVDFIQDEPLNGNTSPLVSLTSRYDVLATIYVRNNDIYFRMVDGTGASEEVVANDILIPGQRYHVAGTFDNNLRLYVNGVLIGTVTTGLNVDQWPTYGTFNVGQSHNRLRGRGTGDNQMHGTFLVAACYARKLLLSQIQENRNRNLSISPTPPALTYPIKAFPPAGISQADLDFSFHVLNRLSFGASPSSISEFHSLGFLSWLGNQLAPEAIDDSEVEALLGSRYFKPKHYLQDLRGALIYRMGATKRQLLEVMTWFWDNHFNTLAEKVGNLEQEYLETEKFREHALGTFRDLLLVSASNFPMTVYLDSNSNVVGAPNENYAREIMELHTFGVNNGYTQTDIEEVARCFTGWTVKDGAFFFHPGLHDYGEKNFLGITIPAGGGLSDGIAVIEHLTSSVNTADFISWKLCQYFIDDEPPSDVVAAASSTFFATGGDIEQTLWTIFQHPRFESDFNYRGNKVRTPLEFILGCIRLTESQPVSNTVTSYLEHLGMELYGFEDPTGFPEEGVSWLDTNSLLERWNMVNDLTCNRGHAETIGINFRKLFETYDLQTSDDILDFFEAITVHGTQPAGVRAIAESWLTDDSPGSFVLTDEVLDNQVRQTLGIYLRLAEMNKQ